MGKRGETGFTAGRVAEFTCPANMRQAFFWDAKTSGRGLRVTPKGAKSYIFELRIAHVRPLDAAGLPHVTLHGLRRTFASLAEWVEMPRHRGANHGAPAERDGGMALHQSPPRTAGRMAYEVRGVDSGTGRNRVRGHRRRPEPAGGIRVTAFPIVDRSRATRATGRRPGPSP